MDTTVYYQPSGQTGLHPAIDANSNLWCGLAPDFATAGGRYLDPTAAAGVRVLPVGLINFIKFPGSDQIPLAIRRQRLQKLLFAHVALQNVVTMEASRG